MSLFSHPIDVIHQESSHHSPPLSKKAPPIKVHRPSPFTRDMKRELHGAFKKLLARAKTAENPQALYSSYFATLEQLSSAGPAISSPALDPSVQVMQLFEKLISALIHTDQAGVAETTLTLNSDAFAASLFYGATLKITEYSTAPKVFNLQFCTSTEGIALFEAHAGELTAALQKGNFGFSIHRLETELQKERLERPLPGEKEPQQEEEQPQ